ncbi:MAG: DUF2806 domain-containing protein [Aquabacterium sp.]|nr:MAG: DUF2806 domain-containing protein [Aquabacterium sp.]
MGSIVTIDGQALTKLVEVVSQGIGKLYEPTHARRMARANGEAALIQQETQFELEKRAQQRISHVELQRQENIEAIVGNAEEALSAPGQTISTEPVEKDWTSRFFNYCQDVSDAQMQSLWGKILAGETAKPGKYSVRTLARLSELSKTEAQLFATLCEGSFRSLGGAGFYPLIFDVSNVCLGELGLGSYDGFLRLQEAGLIHIEAGGWNQSYAPGSAALFYPGADGFAFEVQNSKDNEENEKSIINLHPKHIVPIGLVFFTDSGVQICELANPTRNDARGMHAVRHWQKYKFLVSRRECRVADNATHISDDKEVMTPQDT